MIVGKTDKYSSDVVTAGKAPLFHNNWLVVLSEWDENGNPKLDADGKPIGNYKTLLAFLDGSETYEIIEGGQFKTKNLPVFYFPTTGDNKEWKGAASTTTLTDGENLMVYASDVASINLEVADEVVEAGVAAAQSGVTVQSSDVAQNRAVVLGGVAAQDDAAEQAAQVDAVQTGADGQTGIGAQDVEAAQDTETAATVDPIMLVVSDSQGVIFAAPVTQKVYTIPYDFSTTLTAELIQGDTVQQYTISARDLVHTVMNYDGDYYYMTGSGIRSSAWVNDTTSGTAGKSGNAANTNVSGAAGNSASADEEETVVQGLCEGQFLNMWAGKALDVNGDIWDLATRTVEEHAPMDRDAMVAKAEAVMNASVSTLSTDGTEDGANNIQSVIEAMTQLADTESQPLYQFQYGDITLEVYGKDTISVRGGEENTLDSRVYVKNGYLYPVDNELDTVTGAVLADAYGDNRYLSVLTSEGVIQDLGNDLTLPDGFKNCSIAELADNLASDSRVAIGRYKNGTAFAFDYMTGKTIDLYEDEYDTGNDVGIFDYAKNWIVSKTGSWFGLNNSGYKGAQDMIAQYQKGGSDGILGQLKQIERTITTWKDGTDTTGTADGKDGTANGVDTTEGTDGAGLTSDGEQNGGSEQSKAADQKDNTDLADGSDTTTADGIQNIADASSEKKDSEKANADKADADKADAQEKDSENSADKKQSGDQTDAKESADNSGEKAAAESSSVADASAENAAANTTETTVTEATAGNNGDKSQAELSGLSTADNQSTAGSGSDQKSDAGQTTGDSQSNQSSGTDQTAAGDEAVADVTTIKQSQAKAKDQLVTIYNADTKSYEVYDVEDFLSSPKSEIATVSEKVKELTKQGMINNTTDLKAEDTLTDTNRYGIWIYCGIAAAILLLLLYLADRKRRQWK